MSQGNVFLVGNTYVLHTWWYNTSTTYILDYIIPTYLIHNTVFSYCLLKKSLQSFNVWDFSDLNFWFELGLSLKFVFFCVLLLLYECVFLCYIFRLCVTFCTCVSNLIWFTILEQGKILSHFLLSNFWRILVEISLLENCVMDFSNKELLKLIFKINSTCNVSTRILKKFPVVKNWWLNFLKSIF